MARRANYDVEADKDEAISRSASRSEFGLTRSAGGGSGDAGTLSAEVLARFPEAQRGAIVDGKYQVEDLLGRGGMGFVVSARHIELGERVAIKFLFARDNDSEEMRVRFRREAQVSARLRNEHIARVIDVATAGNETMYMVMEHLDGASLRQLLRHYRQLPTRLAVDYTIQICEGLAEAHARGIVHRDLKPSNLFLTARTDGTDLIKVLDFGISKWDSEAEKTNEDLTHTGAILGSPKYMAPEQLFGSSNVDARADIWSLGAILYELLGGRPPYDFPGIALISAELARGRAPAPLDPAVAPPALNDAIMRAFVINPDDRTQTVAQFAGELLAAIGDESAESTERRIQFVLDSFQQKASGPVAVKSSRVPGRVRRDNEGPTPAPRASQASLSIVIPVTAAPTETLEAARKKAPSPILLALVAVAVTLAIGLFAWRQRPRPIDEVVSFPAVATTTATAVASAPPLPGATAGGLAAQEDATNAAGASAKASLGGGGVGGGSSPRGGGSQPSPPVRRRAQSPAAPATPPPPTPAVASPPPPHDATPKVKPNPLEDRQ